MGAKVSTISTLSTPPDSSADPGKGRHFGLHTGRRSSTPCKNAGVSAPIQAIFAGIQRATSVPTGLTLMIPSTCPKYLASKEFPKQARPPVANVLPYPQCQPLEWVGA